MADGLEPIAREELRDRYGDAVQLRRPAHGRREAGIVRFDYRGDLRALLRLRTVLAVHLVRHYALPRPRALLGDEHFRALLHQIATARALSPADVYRTLYVSAAGADSPVLRRLKEELARHTGLEPVAPEAHAGDLQLRLRRPLDGDGGWEVLVRLSPRPLSARAWRVCNLEGALNATVARAMAIVTRPAPDDVVLNLACGSGTLLIERLDHAPARRAIGCDLSDEALDCAAENVRAAGQVGTVELQPWDARSLPLPDRGVDALLADLPFGHLVGSHADNVALYPAILREAARVARDAAPFALNSHEVRLTESLVRDSTDWLLVDMARVSLGGLHPRIFLLERR